MNILVFYPYYQRSVEQQSVMEMLMKKGHKVFMLSFYPEGFIHDYVRQFGVIAGSLPKPKLKLLDYFTQARFLVGFCRKNKIDIIFVHQQLGALPMMLASPFMKARIAYFRHNSDEDYQQFPVKAKVMNRLLNRFVKRLVAPSQIVWKHWVEVEHVSPKRITRINYGYNYDQYDKPNLAEVKIIQESYPCHLRIVSVARLVPPKRHLLMFQCVKAALNAGVDCKMICVGAGSEEEMLKKWVKDNKLEDRIFFAGFRHNIFDYLAAADLYLHLSNTEASNSSVKEAGLASCASIVCKGVGDFEDYVKNGENSFLVEKDPTVKEVSEIIIAMSKNKEQLKKIGENLRCTVLREFDISQVEPLYEKMIEKMMKNEF
jgi:L-malate glycosyltransferase